MATPVANKVILPLDIGNTGKMIRTQTRVVGADTVHEHFFVQSSERSIKGAYRFDGGKYTISAAATNGVTTGFWWLQVPVAATIKAAVHKIQFTTNLVTNLTTGTLPRITFSRFTFTGTASGAAEAMAYRDSTDAAPQSTLRTAMTGMTITLGAAFWSALPHVTHGTAGWTFANPHTQEYVEDGEAGQVVLRPGEGTVAWQPDAGTTADTRAFINNFCIQEFE